MNILKLQKSNQVCVLICYMVHLLGVAIFKTYMQVILNVFRGKKLALMMANVIFSITNTKLSNSATLVHAAKAPAIRGKDNKRSRFAPQNVIDSQPQGWPCKGSERHTSYDHSKYSGLKANITK